MRSKMGIQSAKKKKSGVDRSQIVWRKYIKG